MGDDFGEWNAAAIVLDADDIMARWIERRARRRSAGQQRPAVDRVDASSGSMSAQQLFEAGTLPAIARFVRQLEEVPAPLAGAWTSLPEFQPLCELRVKETAGELTKEARIEPGDRLFVHIGSITYRGALVIAAFDDGETVRHCIGRLLVFETNDHGPVLRVGRGPKGVVLAEPGTVSVECVIFNRPDILWRRA